MSQNYSYSRCVYFDTNIISIIVEHPEWYRPLFNFLFKNNSYVALPDALLAELSQATRKHDEFNTFFSLLPSAEIIGFEAVIEEEVKSYPKMRADTLMLWSTNLEFARHSIISCLGSDKIREARRKQLLYAKNMKQYLESVRSNFPQSNRGKYNIEQAEIFAWMVTAHWLQASHPDFMKKLNVKRRLLKTEAFPSIQLFAYYVYYKCYLDSRQPKALSDFGDLFHIFYFPCCKLIVLERDMCNILNKIKSHFKMLDNVEVKNVDFFSENQISKK
jgi:hypothetical protein